MHPLSESLRDTATQLSARCELLVTAADELDRMEVTNDALHERIEALVDDWESQGGVLRWMTQIMKEAQA